MTDTGEMEGESKYQYLSRIYTDPSHPASFGGPKRLKTEIDRENKFQISMKEIKEFLEDKDAYTTNRLVHRRHKRNRIVVSSIGQQYDMDLCDMTKMRRYPGNRGTRYLLTVIDVFSRFAFVRPLRDKRGKTVAAALEEVLTETRTPPVRCRSDSGGEFKSKEVMSLLRRLLVKQYFTSSALKCQPVKRFNSTLKAEIYRWCYENRSFAYLPVLGEIVDAYNHRVHSSLFGMSPSEVNDSNQVHLWNLMYASGQRNGKSKTGHVRSFKYRVGDLVRISLAKRTFERAYSQKFTDVIFKIRGWVLRDNIPLYYLMDMEEEPVQSAFYETELQGVRKDLTDMRSWQIEKVLKRKKVGGKEMVLVQFRGMGPKFDRWIPKSHVKKP